MRKNEQPCSPPLSAVPPESLLGAAQITGDRGQIRKFWVILEDFCNLFIYKRFERKDKIEVTNWQPCLFLRFAVSCCQSHSY